LKLMCRRGAVPTPSAEAIDEGRLRGSGKVTGGPKKKKDD